MPSQKHKDKTRACKKCRDSTGAVIDSRVYADGYLHRIRECKICKRRWQTVEVPLFDWEEKNG